MRKIRNKTDNFDNIFHSAVADEDNGSEMKTCFTGINVEKAREKRFKLSLILVFTVIPAIIYLGTRFLPQSWYLFLSIVVLIAIMTPFFLIFEKRHPKVREIVLIATLSGIVVFSHVTLHLLFPIQIGTALIVIFGAAMGSETGFLIGALSRFVCNFYMGHGPWSPWQMFSWGILGFLAGLVFFNHKEDDKTKNSFIYFCAPIISVIFFMLIAYIHFILLGKDNEVFFGWRVYAFGAVGFITGMVFLRNKLPATDLLLTIFTFICTLVIYGGIMNISVLFTGMSGADSEFSVAGLKLLYLSGFSYDLTHAFTAALCVYFLGPSMLKKLERIKVKYGIYK